MLRPSVPIVLADGKTRHLRFDLNAICALEDEWKISVGEIAQRLSDTRGVRVSDIRALLWAALLHEEPGLRPADVGALLDFASLRSLTETLMKALAASFPTDDGEPKNAPEPEPPPAEPQG